MVKNLNLRPENITFQEENTELHMIQWIPKDTCTTIFVAVCDLQLLRYKVAYVKEVDKDKADKEKE